MTDSIIRYLVIQKAVNSYAKTLEIEIKILQDNTNRDTVLKESLNRKSKEYDICMMILKEPPALR